MCNRRRSGPPHNLDAERAVLGAFMLDSPASSQVLDLLGADDFLITQNRTIYRRIHVMRRAGLPVDLLTLHDALEANNELNAAGGVGYIASLIDGVHRLINAGQYAQIVLRDSQLRQLAYLAENFREKALAPEADVETLTRQLAEATQKLAFTRTVRSWQQIPTLDKLPDQEGAWLVPGIIPEASVVLLAGTAGCYKTWLAMSLARAISTGGCFLDRQCLTRRVLYLDRENPAVVWRKRARILQMESTENLRVWGTWMEQPPPLIGDPLLLGIAKEQKPVIILDSFIRFHQADENSASEMAAVMGQLRELANAGATIISPHHRDKAEAQNFRGSTDIQAGVDVAFLLREQGKDGDLQLKCFKNRFDKEFLISLRPDFSTTHDFASIESTYQEQNRITTTTASRHLEQQLVKLIDEYPGQTQNWLVGKIAKPHSEFSKRQVIEALQRSTGKLWDLERGPRKSFLYQPRDADLDFKEDS